MKFITEYPGYCILALKITPRSSKAKVLGANSDQLRISLTAPPVENAANEALIEFLAENLQIAKRNISIHKGLQSREKIVKIQGLSALQISQKLIGQ